MCVCVYFYSGIDHEQIRSTLLQDTASENAETVSAVPEQANLELPVDSDCAVGVVSQDSEVNCHLDTQIGQLNLTNDTPG